MSPDKMILRSPEELGVTFQIASNSDIPSITQFFSKPSIDVLFTPPLSDPARGITINDRVKSKSKNGVWILSLNSNKQIIGCLAVVPTEIPTEIVPPNSERSVSVGIPTGDWKVSKTMELSTVATDPEVKKNQGIKGIGKGLLMEAIKYVNNSGKGKWGLLTDSWLGGDMDGFITHVVNNMKEKPTSAQLDLLIRIYSDPKKRGSSGPPTTLYLIPCSEGDWKFLIDKQEEIKTIRSEYQRLQKQTADSNGS